MEFVSYIRDQSQKLNSRDYVNYLWEELQGHNNEEICTNAISDFNNHLPVLLEQFWELALEKLVENSTLEEIDDELQIYLLVLIYQCVTQSNETVSIKCVLYASEVYLHLLTTRHSDEFYKTKVYLAVLTSLESSVEAGVSQNLTTQLMHKLRAFLTKAKLSMGDLEVTLATLLQIIFLKTDEALRSIEEEMPEKSITHDALLSLKVLLQKETVPQRQFIITTYLFNGLRKHNLVHVTPRIFNMIQMNFRQLMKSLHLKFKEDQYTTFMNAFIHVWKHPDFTYFGEAVFLLNNLKEKYYHTLLDVLKKMLMTREPHRNLFRLSLAVICFPPKFFSVEKTKTSNEILLKSILLHCVSSKSEISNTAVESIAEILMSPDLEKDFIKEPMKSILNCNNDANLTVVTLLRGFQSLISKKWGTKSKNKPIFVIVLSIMLFSENDHPALYTEILEELTEQCSPFDLRAILSLINKTYTSLSEKSFKISALLMLKIMFKMALHPMASSIDFVKHLYSSMILPIVCKGQNIKRELFIDPIISEDFHYVEFFQKCHTLGLIKNEHANKLFGNLLNTNETDMKLCCAIIHLTEYKELSIIAEFINDNFRVLCNRSDLDCLLYIYEKILENNASNLRCNEIMVCFLKHHLLNQTLRWNAIANAFALLKTLGNLTNLEDDFVRLKEHYDGKLSSALQSKISFLPLIYFSHLVIFSRLTPNDENIKSLTDFLTQCSNEVYVRSPEFNPKFWIAALLLYTNYCVIKPSIVESGLDYLHIGLNSPITSVKLASISMTFDLCNLVTHNFEDLIRYMFKQLVYGESIFRKTCLTKIDKLIRDDYLKLDLEQFIVFVSVLADRNITLSEYGKSLLSSSFFISNTNVIGRFFVPLIVHINGYTKHPNYKFGSSGHALVQIVLRNIIHKRKIYDLLFTSLPVKSRFTIVNILCTQILGTMMKGEIKVAEGFWKMINDSVYIFKLLSSNVSEDESNENIYKNVIAQINKNLVQKSQYNEKSQFLEYHREAMLGTETLLKLLFFNDSDNIQRHIRIAVFDAIIHWTHFLMPDLVYIIHVERNKHIQNLYSNFDKFYKKYSNSLIYIEETFEGANVISDEPSCSRTLFSSSGEYVPNFDDE